MPSQQQHLTIMILEDNPVDAFFLDDALHNAEMDFTPILFEDGESACRYIDGGAGTENTPLPDLAILDLNVPRRDGSEVLAHIRRNPDWRHVAVVIFSSTPKQVMKNQAAHADCYITKPTRLDEFLRIGEEIRDCLEAVRATRTPCSAIEIAGRTHVTAALPTSSKSV